MKERKFIPEKLANGPINKILKNVKVDSCFLRLVHLAPTDKNTVPSKISFQYILYKLKGDISYISLIFFLQTLYKFGIVYILSPVFDGFFFHGFFLVTLWFW